MLAAYAVAVTFPHENVQYVVNEIALKISHKKLYQASAAIGIAQALLFSALVLWRVKDRLIALYWVLTIALIVGTWRLLTANNVELVHYPQYVPEGVLLFAMTLSVVESLSWIAILGGLDECFQYWDLLQGKPVQYDFNDIYMDILGGAAGVLIAMVFLKCSRREPAPWSTILKRKGVVAVFAITMITILLLLSGVVLMYADKTNPHYWFALSRDKPPTYFYINPMFGPHKFHTLSPVEGPVLIFLTFALYGLLDRRIRAA
jgi:hypothetical protein